MISLDIGPASDDADVELVEVGGKSLVDSFLELEEVLSGSEIVERWEANILSLDEPILDNLLVMLSYLNSAKVCCSPVVARHVSVVIQKFLQIVIKGVCRGVGVNLHNSNKLLLKSPGSQKSFTYATLSGGT